LSNNVLTNAADGEGGHGEFVFVDGQPAGHPAEGGYPEDNERADVDEAVEAVEETVLAEALDQHQLPCVQKDAVDLDQQRHQSVAQIVLGHLRQEETHQHLQSTPFFKIK